MSGSACRPRRSATFGSTPARYSRRRPPRAGRRSPTTTLKNVAPNVVRPRRRSTTAGDAACRSDRGGGPAACGPRRRTGCRRRRAPSPRGSASAPAAGRSTKRPVRRRVAARRRRGRRASWLSCSSSEITTPMPTAAATAGTAWRRTSRSAATARVRPGAQDRQQLAPAGATPIAAKIRIAASVGMATLPTSAGERERGSPPSRSRRRSPPSGCARPAAMFSAV